MLSKKEYLNKVRDRISCDSDAEREWDAYRGSSIMLERMWSMYKEKGRQLHASPKIAPQVVGLMLMNGITDKQASAVFEPAGRKVVIG